MALCLKILVFALFFLLPVSAAKAQGVEIPLPPGMVDTSKPKDADKKTGGATPVKNQPSAAFLSGSGPINLRPGAYVTNGLKTQKITQAGRKSKPDPNSVASYNKSLADAQKRQKQLQAQQPSPSQQQNTLYSYWNN